MAVPFAAAQAGGDAASSIIGAVGDLFGTSQSTSGTTRETGTVSSIVEAAQKTSGLRTEQLELDPEAIQQIIRDVLGGANGLASIFQGEQTAGIFNSSVSAQAAGDLAAKLVGEIAKITGKTVGTEEGETEETRSQVDTKDLTTTNKTKSADEGVLSGIGDFFGF